MASYDVVSALFSFLTSIGAAVLAINLYPQLRVGRTGASWRVLIIAAVLFALMQALRFCEIVGVPYLSGLRLSSIVEMVFGLALAYAFFLQRQVFIETQKEASTQKRRKSDRRAAPEIEAEMPVVSAYEADY